MPYTNALLRAMLVAEDITMVKEGITKDKCYVVQHYAYSSQRDRVGSLMMSGVEDSSFIDLVIRIADSGTAKQFYQQMTESEPFAYSILFNASFNANERLTGFDDAIMVKGCPKGAIVGIGRIGLFIWCKNTIKGAFCHHFAPKNRE